MTSVNRRDFLTSTASTAAAALLMSRVVFARAGVSHNSRVIFVIMRGALDGLSAVPPYGDPDYAGLRRELAIAGPGSVGGPVAASVPEGALPLDGLFGLHPSLTFLHDAYIARELVVFHALASPYRERSHFEGQDVLENGTPQPHATQTGWLNRALASLQGGGRPRELGVALGQNVPLIMRGPAPVTSWSPSRLAALDEDTLQRVTDLYAADPLLSVRLADALAADAIARDEGPMMQAAKPTRYTEIVHAVAGFLRREDGPQVAVFDTNGWDTHANEGNAQGQLAARLGVLDASLRMLKEELGAVWSSTAVVLATEFGRTAATNGTRGTDHGTATAAFLLGGAVQGGRVIADWPGLSARALYQGRDLKPTLDLRSVLKGVLSEHLPVRRNELESSVFPGSEAARALKGLFRA